jgi:outer membrane lipoprotein-sorting protein
MNMKIKVLLCMLGMLFTTLAISAQNSIDKAVDEYSSIGKSTFTSAVERDPKTRKVLKVVKILQPTDMSINKLRKAFLQEQENGQFSIMVNGEEETMTLTVENEKENRVYMMKYANHRSSFTNGKVTIIIRYK